MNFLERISQFGQSLLKNLFYRTVRNSARIFGVLIFDLRIVGRHHMDFDGSAVVLSTHQSHFDPVLIGLSYNGRMNYLARRTLFNNRLLGTIIYLLDAIELDRDRSGIAGLKETLKRLKNGRKVLVFPEGTRTSDGQIAPLRPGFLSVARRGKAPLLPIAVTGAFEALPRTSRWPWRYPICVAIGRRIEADVVASMSDDEVLALLTQRLKECFHQANELRS